MQSAETSKTMLPCKRRVHLHKTASLKTVFKQSQHNHKNNVSVGAKMVEQSIKKEKKKLCELISNHSTPNTPNIQIVAHLLEPVA